MGHKDRDDYGMLVGQGGDELVSDGRDLLRRVGNKGDHSTRQGFAAR